uniref:Odorant receptor n=1 Tax=Ostrinia furnacalis TaxID=93504 RepID=A0A0E4B3W9_OSTFU|nr:putative olfactory receptor 44 [Ostrinia furnacalis]
MNIVLVTTTNVYRTSCTKFVQLNTVAPSHSKIDSILNESSLFHVTMTHTFLHRPKTALTMLGLWLLPENYKVPYLIYRSFQLSIQFTFLLFNFIYMGVVWGDLEESSEGFYLLFTQATLCLKSTTFVMNRTRLIRLLRFMESDIFATNTPKHKRILAVQAVKMWQVYMFFMTCATCNVLEWAVVPLLESRGPRVFPFKIWMPADPAMCPDYVYTICYVYQAVTVYLSATTFLTIDFMTVSMITFASAQLEIIAEKIKQIPPVATSSENLKAEEVKSRVQHNNKILNECIQQHQAVIRFVGLVENMFNVNIFFQMSGTVAIICIIGFRITIEPPNSFHFYSTLNYLVTMVAQLYLYCWCGNELTERSQVLRDTLYTSQWYEQDRRFGSTLGIAMECMKRPIIFRAGYYIPLSRPTFVSILRCSYSYFAVLNQANNK